MSGYFPPEFDRSALTRSETTEEDDPRVLRRQAALAIAVVLLVGACIFLAGYFVGKGRL